MFMLALAALTITVHPTPIAVQHRATCSPVLDGSFVHLLPSSKSPGSLVQPLTGQLASRGKAERAGGQACIEFIG